MSDLATGRTPSFSAAESIALYASSRRTWAKAAQREWKGLTSRLGKHRADVADSAGAAAPDPPAAASGTLGCELPFKFHPPPLFALNKFGKAFIVWKNDPEIRHGCTFRH